MKEQYVELEGCKPGDILSRDVIDIRTGIVLCNAGHTMNATTLEWLKKFVHSEIYIEQDSWNKVWNLSEDTIKTYDETKNKLGDLLESFKHSKVVDPGKLQEIKGSFYSELSHNNTIMGCVNIVKKVDEYTHTHCMNVGMLAVLIGKWLHLSEEQLSDLFLAGALHDAGKYKVTPSVINKRGSLTNEEYNVVKKHVIYGYELIKDIKDISEEVKHGVLGHHERIDGTGYPRELAGDEIHLFGKIIAIADTYDAMISERVYKKRQTPFEVMEAMEKEGLDKLDTKILLTFLHSIADYYTGVFVKLNTGAVGEVIFIHPHCVYRPIVKVDEQYIDLDTQRNIRIMDIV
ncbi:MAG: HD-GYP domain-containing protein [Cellulosilyticaceae bacterium]